MFTRVVGKENELGNLEQILMGLGREFEACVRKDLRCTHAFVRGINAEDEKILADWGFVIDPESVDSYVL